MLCLCALQDMLFVLDLSGNGFTSVVPVELATCVGITTLFLGGNNLSSIVPMELFSSRQLQKIDLRSNALIGDIPAPSGTTVLEYLDLSNNSLTNIISSLLSMLSKLSHLDLGINQLTIPMPELLSHCRLYFLGIYRN
ncbi:hypothetical protein GUJ93_ZPchr0010g8129 [Zizania palustris]|uniref:Uncharacterized protein n=1 Tax=Zizania palustris TaxID=103762 RepID=A0A8J5WGU0_ZIZPA|nr:hypothetical protein GUJ93_ZPchr0010g8129 [Zizania palustris]